MTSLTQLSASAAVQSFVDQADGSALMRIDILRDGEFHPSPSPSPEPSPSPTPTPDPTPAPVQDPTVWDADPSDFNFKGARIVSKESFVQPYLLSVQKDFDAFDASVLSTKLTTLDGLSQISFNSVPTLGTQRLVTDVVYHGQRHPRVLDNHISNDAGVEIVVEVLSG